MRKRCLLMALAFSCVLPLCACAESLSALKALVPGATDDAFAPYQSTSPNGAWILDVRKEEDEDSGMAFAAIRVLSAQTGETLYDCPRPLASLGPARHRLAVRRNHSRRFLRHGHGPLWR